MKNYVSFLCLCFIPFFYDNQLHSGVLLVYSALFWCHSPLLHHILGFHMTSRPPCWCPKQRKGGHVGAPTKSSGNLTLLLCKRFLLFSLKNMAVDHVSENQQFRYHCCSFRCHSTLFQSQPHYGIFRFIPVLCLVMA